MAEINFNFEQYDGQIAKASMARLRKAAEVIAQSARDKCKEGDKYYKYVNKKTGRIHIVPGMRGVAQRGNYAGVFWTERSPGAMRDTIRAVEKKEMEYGSGCLSVPIGKNVRVYAGTKKTWWATQMEYGRGGWKGGRRSFMRPALRSTKSQVQQIIENG